MPAPLKPCPGQFSDEVQQALLNDTDRARWKDHPCELCGQLVSAQLYKSRWEPDRHWKSVTYSTEKKRIPPRYSRVAEPVSK